jgi:hypothetical protein
MYDDNRYGFRYRLTYHEKTMTLKKIIIVGFIVLMLESIAGYVYLTYVREPAEGKTQIQSLNRPSQLPEASITTIKQVELALKTDLGVIKHGDNFKIDVILDTFSAETSAADLTLKYDPAFLSIQATASAKPFSDSTIFSRTVFNSLNAKQGLATMSAVNDLGKYFSGKQILTSLTFRALRAGLTEITIVFTPGETRDTNIVSESVDILSKAEGLSIDILPK